MPVSTSLSAGLVVRMHNHGARDQGNELALPAQNICVLPVRDDCAHLRARERRPAQTAGHLVGESRPVLSAVKARRYAPPAGS
jgi:hypothetical protein